MLEVKGKKLRYSKTLWADFGGVRAMEEKDVVTIEGVDEDSYVEILNHFGRVLKLYTFENGAWLDLETGAAPAGLDETLAGRVEARAASAQVTGTPAKPSRPAASRKSGGKKSGRPAPKSAGTIKSKAAKATRAAGGAKAKTPKPGAARTKANSKAAVKPAATGTTGAAGSKKDTPAGTSGKKTRTARKPAKN